jgi:hypothetical protein
MIKKSFTICLILCAGYAIIISYIHPAWSTSQHQWQSNKIKAEEFLYKSNKIDSVIIGSSLSTKIAIDELPDGFYNLSFAGQSIYDGLEIIKNSKNTVKRIFIETNMLFRGKNKEFLSTIFNPVLFYSKAKIPILRSENQPIGVIGNCRYVSELFWIISKDIKAVEKRLLPQSQSGFVSSGNRIDFTIDLLKKQNSSLPNENDVMQTVKLLSEYIAAIEKRDIQVAFFEMPIDQCLCGLEGPVAVRRIIKTYFRNHLFIPQPVCAEYSTTDGLHLVKESASAYTRYFSRYITSVDESVCAFKRNTEKDRAVLESR